MIYDSVCYDAKQAKALCDIVNDYPAHVVFTSTMAHLEAKMSFILAEEAASFLQWLATQTGAWNATANGTISMGALLQLIESVTGERAIVTTEGDSPYNIPKSWYISNDKATAVGFSFSSLDVWLRLPIAHLATY